MESFGSISKEAKCGARQLSEDDNNGESSQVEDEIQSSPMADDTELEPKREKRRADDGSIVESLPEDGVPDSRANSDNSDDTTEGNGSIVVPVEADGDTNQTPGIVDANLLLTLSMFSEPMEEEVKLVEQAKRQTPPRPEELAAPSRVAARSSPKPSELERTTTDEIEHLKLMNISFSRAIDNFRILIQKNNARLQALHRATKSEEKKRLEQGRK